MRKSLSEQNRELRAELADTTRQLVELRTKYQALESRRRFENIAYRAKAKAPKPARPDWGSLAREYCTEFGCNSVDRPTLEAYSASQGHGGQRA